MTCIVGLVGTNGTVWMGGDRAKQNAAPKVLRIGPMLMGCTGVRAGHDVLEMMSRNLPDCTGEPDVVLRERIIPLLAELCERHFAVEQDPKGKVYPRYLIGLGGRLFLVDNGMGITERQGGYDAIGQGMDVALGALFATNRGFCDSGGQVYRIPERRRIEWALQAAEHLLDGVRGPFDILSLTKAPCRHENREYVPSEDRIRCNDCGKTGTSAEFESQRALAAAFRDSSVQPGQTP